MGAAEVPLQDATISTGRTSAVVVRVRGDPMVRAQHCRCRPGPRPAGRAPAPGPAGGAGLLAGARGPGHRSTARPGAPTPGAGRRARGPADPGQATGLRIHHEQRPVPGLELGLEGEQGAEAVDGLHRPAGEVQQPVSAVSAAAPASRARGAPDRLTHSAPSSWKVSAAEAMRNSIVPGWASAARRITSSVQPTGRPSRRAGSQLVSPVTRPSASTASRQRTASSVSSSRPPSVKPISGSPLAASHSSERLTTCCRSPSGASDQASHCA